MLVKKLRSDIENITIIIPAKIIEKNLIKCIDVCQKSYPNSHIIVALDHLDKKKIKKRKNLRFVVTGPLTIGKKRNLAVKLSNTKFIGFIDSDAYPNKNWLENALEILNKKKDVIAVGGTELEMPNQSFSEECVSNASKSLLVTALNFRKNIKYEKYCNYLPSCNLILKRSSYVNVGGMDENLLTGEDWNFGDRLRKKGKKILYSPKIQIFHKNRNLINFFKQRLVYGEGIIDLLRKKINPFYSLSFIPLIFFLFLMSFPLAIMFSSWMKIYISVLIIYFFLVLYETFRLSKKFQLFFGTFVAILIGNITPGIGTFLKIIGLKLNVKKIYKNY